MLRLTFALLVSASSSQQPLVVVVDSALQPSDDALVATSKLRDVLAQRDARLAGARSLEVDDPAQNAATSKGQRLLRQATKSREQGLVDDAKSLYTEAATALEGSDLRRSFNDLVEATAWSAALNRDDESMRLVFSVRPKFVFRAGQLSPETESWVDGQRASKASARQVAFEITTNVPAVVWLDGVELGAAPIKAETLAGRHRLAAWAPGYALLQTEETITKGTNLVLELQDAPRGNELRAGLETIRGGFRTGDYLIPIQRFAQQMKAAEVIVVGVDVVEGVRKMTVVRMTAEGRASKAMRTIGAGDPIVETAAPIISSLYDQPIGVDLTETWLPVSRRTLAYASWGIGAASLLTAVILTAVAISGFNAANQIPLSQQDRYLREFYAARNALGASYVMYGFSAAGIGVGTWLFLSSRGLTEPEKPEPAREKDPF